MKKFKDYYSEYLTNLTKFDIKEIDFSEINESMREVDSADLIIHLLKEFNPDVGFSEQENRNNALSLTLLSNCISLNIITPLELTKALFDYDSNIQWSKIKESKQKFVAEIFKYSEAHIFLYDLNYLINEDYISEFLMLSTELLKNDKMAAYHISKCDLNKIMLSEHDYTTTFNQKILDLKLTCLLYK